MFYVTTIVKQADGRHKIWEGAVVRVPPELVGGNNLKRVLQSERLGWSTVEFGYSCYTLHGALGETYIISGINVPEFSKVTKRFHSYDITFSKRQIENVSRGIAQFAEETRRLAEEEFGVLIHDLRALSTAIYNAALEGKRFVENRNMEQALVRFENIMAAQSILRYRTDVLDYTGNVLPDLESDDVAIFRKVDKVCRSFKPKAFDRRINIILSGASIGVCKGPDIFEIVPYTIVDNAIKYAPDGSDIHVEMSESSQNITVQISSLGPRIEDNEKEQIFLRGVRATAAAMSPVPGTGIGLYIVKKIVEQYFAGSVHVRQDQAPLEVGGKAYFMTRFSCVLPRAG